MSEESDNKHTDNKNCITKNLGKHGRNRHPLKVSTDLPGRTV